MKTLKWFIISMFWIKSKIVALFARTKPERRSILKPPAVRPKHYYPGCSYWVKPKKKIEHLKIYPGLRKILEKMEFDEDMEYEDPSL